MSGKVGDKSDKKDLGSGKPEKNGKGEGGGKGGSGASGGVNTRGILAAKGSAATAAGKGHTSAGGFQPSIEDSFQKSVKFSDKNKVVECSGCAAVREKLRESVERWEVERRATKEEMAKLKNAVEVDLKKIRAENVACEKSKVEVKAVEVELREKIESIEKEVADFFSGVNDKLGQFAAAIDKVGNAGLLSEGASVVSDTNNNTASSISAFSGPFSTASGSCFSDHEVNYIKNLVKQQDEKDRQENIVLKGVTLHGDFRAGVEKFLWEQLGVRAEIVRVRRSGNVFVVKMGRWEDRNAVLSNKFKLKGTKYFIESDLSFEDRKRQEKINAWVKEKRAGDVNVNVKGGFGGFWLDGRWYKWLGVAEADVILNRRSGRAGSGDKGGAPSAEAPRSVTVHGTRVADKFNVKGSHETPEDAYSDRYSERRDESFA